MNIKLRSELTLCTFLFLTFLFVLPAFARVDGYTSSAMDTTALGCSFEQYNSRFEGFGSKTFKEISDTFGVPVENAVSDLGLLEEMGIHSLQYSKSKNNMGFQGRKLPATWL